MKAMALKGLSQRCGFRSSSFLFDENVLISLHLEYVANEGLHKHKLFSLSYFSLVSLHQQTSE